MNRRRLIAGALAAFVIPDVVKAQAPKMYRIGYLAGGPAACPPTTQSRAFRQGLLDGGYIEGRDVVLDRRCFPTNDMVGSVLDGVLKGLPHVLVASGATAALTMKDKAPGVPVVFVDVPDPVGLGMVRSLSRPGASMTGLTNVALDLNAKRVQLLKQALPGIRLIATLGIPDAPGLGVRTDKFRSDVDEAGTTLGLQVRHFIARAAADLPGAFEAMKKDGVQAFIVMQAALFFAERAQMANLATRHRLAGIYTFRAQVEAGGLISYGADEAELYRRAAGYVVEILKGAKPSDLPVEQPTKFVLAINLRTAEGMIQ